MAAKGRILVVDDEHAILRVLSIKLRVAGYDVITALNGEEALKLVASANPDLLLLDLLLPGMDGLQVMENLRDRSDLPIIVISARPDLAQKALSLGAAYFLAKPFDVDDLVGKTDRLLDRNT
jgi:two-component system, OmpR family, KDP operon response regulator KdpE